VEKSKKQKARKSTHKKKMVVATSVSKIVILRKRKALDVVQSFDNFASCGWCLLSSPFLLFFLQGRRTTERGEQGCRRELLRRNQRREKTEDEVEVQSQEDN
jgi:hypothetical protein